MLACRWVRDKDYSKSRQLGPVPISTTMGTASLWTPSISS